MIRSLPRSDWRRCRLRACLAVFATLALTPATAAGKDYVLTIGGGYSPLANQVSIERNVLFFRDVVADRLPQARHDILFSDGNSPGRDVQLRPAMPTTSPAWKLLAEVFQQEKHWGLEYRTHEVPGVLGAATRENVVEWFDDVARRTGDGDRVIVYVTAHGGKAAGPDGQNTEIYLWNSQRMPMADFTAQLDKLSPEVHVVVVMVQCHAGGFANVIFSQGLAAKGLSSSRRCGFFATLFDRPAAGCTPDVRTENDREYSSFFWAALGGKTRDAMTLAPVDYDGDGTTSLAEAHAFAVIHARSVDVPLRTSEALLRQISPNISDAAVGPYSFDATFDALLSLADTIDRAVLIELGAQLLADGGAAPIKQARDLAAEAIAQRTQMEARQQKLAVELAEASARIRAALVARWPELANPWSPEVFALIDKDAAAIARAIESHRGYAEFRRLRDEVEAISAERLDLTRRWTKCQRLARTIENVILAANLPLVVPSDAHDRYRQLAALERQPLAPLAAMKVEELR